MQSYFQLLLIGNHPVFVLQKKKKKIIPNGHYFAFFHGGSGNMSPQGGKKE